MARSARVRTCVVDAGGVGATDFRLSPDQMHLLIESGRSAADSFLNDFDVSSYVNVFGRTFTSPEPAPA